MKDLGMPKKFPESKGGSGICQHCGEWRNNISFHEATQCAERSEQKKTMKYEFYTYPEDTNSGEDFPLYFIEFSRWHSVEDARRPSDCELRWQLFRKNFIFSKEEFEQMHRTAFRCREGHPWNLGEGVVQENPNAVNMHTMEFLKFMVDALNEKAQSQKR
jgi:hypothetical protein